MKKLITLLLPAFIMLFIPACGNPYVKTVSSNSDTIVKQVATPHESAYKVDGDGGSSWFDATPKDFFKKYKTQNASMAGMKLTTENDEYEIEADGVRADIELPYDMSQNNENCIAKIEASAKGNTQEEANINGKFIDSLIRTFNPDDADTIEKELYIFETPPDGTQLERDVICGNVEYYYTASGQFSIQPIVVNTVGNKSYLPQQ